MTRYIVIFICMVGVTSIDATVMKQRQDDSKKVEDQHSKDLKRKEHIQKEIRAFMKDINENINGKEPLIVPIDPALADDVVDHDEYDKQKPAREEKAKGDERLIAPTQGEKTSPYGYRKNPVTKKNIFHKGIDIAAPRGTSVIASAGGTVVTSRYLNNGYGNCIIIEHPNNVTTLYAHLDKLIVNKGDVVRQGQQIGTVGATGRATGPHLHYEVHKGGKSINPADLVHF